MNSFTSLAKSGTSKPKWDAPLLQLFPISTQEPAEPTRLLEVNTRENREGGVDQGAAGAAGQEGGEASGGRCPQGEGGLEGNTGAEVEGGGEGEKDGEEGGEREQNGEEGGTGTELMEEERRCCPQEVS